MFGAVMSSSVHVDNRKKRYLILCKLLMQGLEDAAMTAEAEYSINFTEQKNYLTFHCNGKSSYIFVNSIQI